jgi:hypothetical protein
MITTLAAHLCRRQAGDDMLPVSAEEFGTFRQYVRLLRVGEIPDTGQEIRR